MKNLHHWIFTTILESYKAVTEKSSSLLGFNRYSNMKVGKLLISTSSVDIMRKS